MISLFDIRCLLETRLQEFEWQRATDDSYDQKKCHGLILFLAELVAQMDETFAFTLGGLLIEFITKILKKPASNIVKYICQALKVSHIITNLNDIMILSCIISDVSTCRAVGRTKIGKRQEQEHRA